jgi:Ca-activated chloride channel family protein
MKRVFLLVAFISLVALIYCDGVHVDVIPQEEYLSLDKNNDVNVLVKITGPLPPVDKKRTPFDFVVVLDRSGSMSGQPLEHSKKTILKILDDLAPQDRLHLVVYDDQVDVLFKD